MSGSADRMHRLVLNLRDVRPVWAMPGWVAEEIRAELPDGWEVRDLEAPADGRGDGGEVPPEVLDAVRGAEVYIGYGAPEPLFRAATSGTDARLRWVHSAAAGVAGSLHTPMLESSVTLTNSAAIHAEPIAESVIGMILHFARGFDLAARAQAERRWLKTPFESDDTPVREIAATTVGIVGYGGIGREVARRARALGMRVVATRRRATDETADGVEVLSGDGALDALLPRSDHLVITAPATPETRGLIDAAALGRLPPGAVVINVARGSLVDEGALIDALRDGHIRGAGLDVFEREPLPQDSPLWTLPNVLITPHVAATTRGFWRRQTDLIRANLRRYLAGEPLLNTVDRRAGY
jgi:phosphoglycerate dehydrogenase-like enzyme